MTEADPHAPGRRSKAYNPILQAMLEIPPGGSLVYHVDSPKAARCPGTMAAAWDAKERGLITLVQRRLPDDRLAYVAVRAPTGA